MADPNNVKSIFLAASEKPAAERATFLDEAVGDDSALRMRVEALLKAHDNPDSFLKEAAAEFGATIDLSPAERPLAEKPGTLIGPYKLLEQIGEGGMGVVYMADQQAPVRRRVALKIIKAGMDTRQVIARFEAERQALALMDHSNIARVLDAGATESGRPYFVMELVRGVPITEYCDQNNLAVHERLELFVQVCSAVQHAHQKGIIHRDLKPSNVLVTLNDGRAVPKVIDFGVAKATGQQLTERTLFTAFAQMVGTPLYMSPEQAEMTSLDIDTRSDIYSLGVLLYELLTGTTPFDQQRMRSAAFDEIRRIIREEEPPKPSTRISTLGESRTATAAHRQVDAHRLGRLMKGDLDWIVMKCLEKDRTRRYDTANSLALDIQRYLHDEAVEACPPSAIYRAKKFIRRNLAALVVGAVIMVLLLASIVIQTLNNARIRRESDARAAALKSKESTLATIREAVEQMARLESQTQGRLSEIPEGPEIYRALQEDTLRVYQPILARAHDDSETNYEIFVLLESVAVIQLDLGQYEEARKTAQRCIDVVQQKLDSEPDNPVYLAALGRAEECMVGIMASQLTGQNEAQFVAYCGKLLDLRREFNRRWPDNTQPTAYCLQMLSGLALSHRDNVLARRLLSEGVALARIHLSQPQSLLNEWNCASWLAIDLARLVRDDSSAGVKEAEPMFEQALLWAQGSLNKCPSRLMKYTVATAELELSICRFQLNPSTQPISLAKRASAEFRRQSLNFPSDPKCVGSARWAQGTIVSQLRQLGRDEEANNAARHMADWLREITPRAPDDEMVQKELKKAQAETTELLRATGQEHDPNDRQLTTNPNSRALAADQGREGRIRQGR